MLTPYSLDTAAKKMTAANILPTGETDDLYGEEERDEDEEASATNVSGDAMIKVKDKSSAGKKGPGKANKNVAHTKKKPPKTSNKRK